MRNWRARCAGVQPAREQADYDAWFAPPDEARRAIEFADAFITAIEILLGPPAGEAS